MVAFGIGGTHTIIVVREPVTRRLHTRKYRITLPGAQASYRGSRSSVRLAGSDASMRDRASAASADPPGPATGNGRLRRGRARRIAASGSSTEQISWASGHLVRNRQPDGGLIGLGSSPAMPAPRLVRAISRLGHRDGRDQASRVRMRRALVDVVTRADLDQLAQVHHADPGRHVLDDGHVVRDDDIGQVVVGLQPLHQVEHLRPDRHVERADRLVGDDHLRVQRQRPRQADPLALTAGELVRVPLDRVPRQPDLVQQVVDALLAVLPSIRSSGWPAAP